MSNTHGLTLARTLMEYDGKVLCPKGGKELNARILSVLDELISEKSKKSDGLMPYEILVDRFYRMSCLAEAIARVDWMNQVKDFLPENEKNADLTSDKSIEDASAALGLALHSVGAQQDMPTLFLEAKKQPLSAEETRNLALMYRQWLSVNALNSKQSEKFSKLKIQGYNQWKKSKKSGDFESYRPVLTELFDMSRIKGKSIADSLGFSSAYEGLLTEFNADLPASTIEQTFERMKTEIPPLIDEVQRVQQKSPPLPLPFDIPIAAQERAVARIVDAIGFDRHRGRIDAGASPFSAGEFPDDVRQTACFYTELPFEGLFSTLHETGHSVYSQNLPKDSARRPISRAQSMWFHETQSYFWERMVGQTPEFFEYYQPILIEELKKEPSLKDKNLNVPSLSPMNLYKIATQAERNFIRFEAMGLVAPMHILVRDIEREVINGDAKVSDIPALWNARMKTYLGLDVPNDTKGCLQDVHWSDASIGYFPAYAFGTFGAAQIKAAMRRDIPDLDDHIRTGNFAPITEWLAKNIHQKACHSAGDVLFEEATGKPLGLDDWKAEIQKSLIEPYTKAWNATKGNANESHAR